MSNAGYHGSCFVYPDHRRARNAIVSPGTMPANQQPQQHQQQQQHNVMSPFHHSHSSAPTSIPGFYEAALHTPQPFPPPTTTSSYQPTGPIVGHPAYMSTPLSRSQYPGYAPMDPHSPRHAGVTVTASELQIEPRSLYPAEFHSPHAMPFFTGPADFGPVNPYYPQNQESLLEQRLSSPSQIGSPHEATSPSVAGSGISDKATDQPYAKLIFEALKGAPNHSMVLKQIYAWFEKYTDKPQRAPAGKQGWKNSIRHNLSMNEAFVKIAPENIQEREGNKGCIWRLSSKALADNNVLSTTRYRSKNTSRNPRRQSSVVLHQRQGNGGRILKRSPAPESANRSHETMPFQPAFSDEPMQNFSASSPYTSANYPYPSSQAFSGPMYSIDITQTHAPMAPFSGDGQMVDSSFSLYPPAAGTPASAISTAGDSGQQEPVISGDSSDEMSIKLEEADVDGVSTRAQGFDLFESEARDSGFLGVGHAEEEYLAPKINATLAEYQSMLSLDELTDWPIEQFKQMSSQEQGPFLPLARL